MRIDLIARSRSPQAYAGTVLELFRQELPGLLSSAVNPIQHEAIPAGLGHRIDRFTALALICIRSLQNRVPAGADSQRVGVYVGNAFAGWAYGGEQLAHLVAEGPEAVHAFQSTAWFPAAAQGEITILTGFKGQAKTFSGSRCPFSEAMLAASMALSANVIDFAFVGAAESCVSPYLAWGSGMGHSEHAEAEGAFFALISQPGALNGARPISVEVVNASQATVSRSVLLPPAWISELDRGFAVLAPDKPLTLPFTSQRVLEISSI